MHEGPYRQHHFQLTSGLGLGEFGLLGHADPQSE